MTKKHFDNVKNQIGACGIWCGSCVAGNGVIQLLTQKYAKIIDDYGLKQWAPEDFDFEELSKGLVSIQKMPLCPGCLKGGGRDDCEIRFCITQRHISDCSECDDQDKCPHTELLNKMRMGAQKACLFTKTEHAENHKLIREWSRLLKDAWPSSILFSGE